jgi:hypothetical protein
MTLKMELMGFPETSVQYHSTLRRIPEASRFHLQRGGSLKSRKEGDGKLENFRYEEILSNQWSILNKVMFSYFLRVIQDIPYSIHFEVGVFDMVLPHILCQNSEVISKNVFINESKFGLR